jgi:hypothetical protein
VIIGCARTVGDAAVNCIIHTSNLKPAAPTLCMPSSTRKPRRNVSHHGSLTVAVAGRCSFVATVRDLCSFSSASFPNISRDTNALFHSGLSSPQASPESGLSPLSNLVNHSGCGPRTKSGSSHRTMHDSVWRPFLSMDSTIFPTPGLRQFLIWEPCIGV